MAKMSNERKGEIALALLMTKWKADGGVKIGPSLQRELGRLAKDTGISRDELQEFAAAVLPAFVGMAFGMNSVSITMSDPVKPRPETDGINL
jgi:hypothetical protein